MEMELPRHHTITLLSSSSSTASNRRYEFHDDFPSIAASESTRAHSDAPSDEIRDRRKQYAFSDDFTSIHGSEPVSSPVSHPPKSRTPVRVEHADVDLTRGTPCSFTTSERPSFASSIRKRIAVHPTARRQEDQVQIKKAPLPLARRECDVDDSIVNDWRRAAQIKCTPSVSVTSEAPPKGCASFISKVFVPRTKNEDADTPQKHRFEAKRETERCSAVMDDKTVDDVHFISILAYDDFMHSPNNPSLFTRMFSRLRRV